MTQATQLVRHMVLLASNIGTSDSNDQIGGLTVNSDGAVTLNAGDYSINGCGETPANCASTWSLSESFTTRRYSKQ
ncbi:MAG: hypothetical protein CM15mV65_260 [Caudoviricetes sp.]|nr:MAG: hypothetical protein CM15mV65_260 [Caudoviricetes sp.]